MCLCLVRLCIGFCVVCVFVLCSIVFVSKSSCGMVFSGIVGGLSVCVCVFDFVPLCSGIARGNEIGPAGRI